MAVVSLRKKLGWVMNFETALQKVTHKYEQAAICTFPLSF